MSTWQPLADAIARYADIDRPVVRCVVTDVTLWAATGPAYVGLALPNGSQTQAVYRDMPAPSVGQVVSAVRMSADPQSLWLVLPAPSATHKPALFVFSAYDHTRGDPATGGVFSNAYFQVETDPYMTGIVALCADGTWEYRSPHPCWGAGRFNFWHGGLDPGGSNGDDSYASRFPLARCDNRLFTWSCFSDQPYMMYDWPLDPDYSSDPYQTDETLNGRYFNRATNGAVANCYYSDDYGYTWIALAAIAEVRWLEQGAPSLPIYAVTDDGEHIRRSTDSGATWSAPLYSVPNAGTLSAYPRIHRLACDPLDGDTVVWTSADGLYRTTDNFATVSGPLGPDWHYEDTFWAAANAAGRHLNDDHALHGDGLLRTRTGRTLAYRLEAGNRSNVNGTWGPSDPYPVFVRAGADPGPYTGTYPWDGQILYRDEPWPASGAFASARFVAETGSEGIVQGATTFPDGRPTGVNGTDYWRVGDDLYLSVVNDSPALLRSSDDGATWTTLYDKDTIFAGNSSWGARGFYGGAGVYGVGTDVYIGCGHSWFGWQSKGTALLPSNPSPLQNRLLKIAPAGTLTDATTTLRTDTAVTPDGFANRQWAWFDHGMAPGDAAPWPPV